MGGPVTEAISGMESNAEVQGRLTGDRGTEARRT